MKVADYIIQTLASRGVREVFLVYGAANGDLVDAFTRTNDTRYICVMHEQAGGFAAEAYARVSRGLGVALATSGPGGMNFVTPIGNCFYESIPCLFLTGQINSRFLRPDMSIRQVGFQETDIVGIVRPITKYAKMVTRAEDIRYELEKAIFFAQEGRPGPVLLDLPLDIQKQEIDPGKLLGFDLAVAARSYDREDLDSKIDAFLADFQKSARPVLMVGGGVQLADATAELREVAAKLAIPAYPTWNALDVVTSDFEYYGGRIGTYGGAGRNFGIQNADLLLAVGSRISGRITGGNISSFARGAKKYVVDVDEMMLQRKLQQVPFDVCISADAKLFLKRLLEKLNGKKLTDHPAWLKRARTWREKYDPVLPEYFGPGDTVNPYAFVRLLSERAGSQDIIIADCGGNVVTANHAFETKHGQRFFSNNGNSPMGFSFAAAIGAAFRARDDQNVICIIGDGGFNMNIQELQTIKNYGVRIKVVLLNNHIYGITKAYQETNFFGRSEACGPKGYTPPDFVKICGAYGIRTLEVAKNDVSEMKKSIDALLSAKETVVCDVNCHEWHTYEPKIIGWETPIEDMYPYLDRKEFLDNMSIPPLESYKNPFMPSVQGKKQ